MNLIKKVKYRGGNTLASALWMVEYLVTLAQHGVSGVGVEGGLGACRGYTPLCVPGATGAAPGTGPAIDPIADASLGAATSLAGRLSAQPDFYGLLLVHELTATSGVKLGDAEVRSDGGWQPQADTRLAGAADGLHVRVPAAAALLTI